MPGYARVACFGHVHGKPYEYCSRNALKRALDALAAEGLTFYTGIEPEFMLLARRADGKYGPADESDALDKPCYDYKGLSRSRVFLERHRRLLALVCAMPYVELVALSGSIAHMQRRAQSVKKRAPW